MINIFRIAANETRRIFVSPLAWVVLAGLQFIFGGVYWLSLLDFRNNDGSMGADFGVTDYLISGTLVGFPLVLMLLVMPMMTMRSFAEERKTGTITLLFSAPVSLTEVVLGKFLGVISFVLAIILMLAAMSFVLMPPTGYQLDLGRIAASFLGLFLMLAAFASAGLFVSSLTREPVVSAVLSLVLVLALWLVQIPSSYDGMPFKELWAYLSLMTHFDSLRRGVFDSADVAYYLLFSTLFLWLTVQRLDLERN
ncbi:ABC transporter permease [Solimonas sp. K1W22B-7]|uniref:ABC transporter permease n=1 Tax=Solimonas sp. K1W22B-7 TaxID=2303331 RepID=UPI000E335B66|nr:ABC transporter permease [Solimonas sp. K1W22B-7]AXQ27263.1 ABC transporter permease [Solimonas sp. K1W22B-7]